MLDSAVTPGGCWVHYSSVLVAGYRRLRLHQAVQFAFEAIEQDGYLFRATEVWPADQAPVRTYPEPHEPSPAYDSSLRISLHDDNGSADPDLD